MTIAGDGKELCNMEIGIIKYKIIVHIVKMINYKWIERDLKGGE